jgi:hypothetical protein
VWEPDILVTLAVVNREHLLAALYNLSVPIKEQSHVTLTTVASVEQLEISPRSLIYYTAHSRGELRIFNERGM